MNVLTDRQVIASPARTRWPSAGSMRLLVILGIGLALVTLIAVVQDLIHSRINNYSFYLSESLLFKSFWFSFFPIVFFQWKYLEREGLRSWRSGIGVVLVPTLAHVLLAPTLITSVSALFFSHTYSFQKSFRYMLGEDLYKALLVYGVLAFASRYLARRSASEAGTDTQGSDGHDRVDAGPRAQPERSEGGTEFLTVSYGRKYVPVPVGSILYISAATPYVTLHLAGERFLHNESLRSIEARLNRQGFVRVHKSTIVNLNKVRSYRSRMNGDYDVLLEDGTEVRLSRNFVAGFRERLGDRPQVDR